MPSKLGTLRKSGNRRLNLGEWVILISYHPSDIHPLGWMVLGCDGGSMVSQKSSWSRYSCPNVSWGVDWVLVNVSIMVGMFFMAIPSPLGVLCEKKG